MHSTRLGMLCATGLLATLVACGSSDSEGATPVGTGGTDAGVADSASSTGGTNHDGGSTGGSGGGATGGNGGAPSTGGAGGSSTGGSGGSGQPGWLHTVSGDGQIRNANDTPWMARGVNIDDLFHGGYNCNYWMGDDGEAALMDTVKVLMDAWKPTFVRVSLSMSSYYPSGNCPGAVLANWTDPIAQNPYKSTMTKVIDYLGSRGAYVLVTLRTDNTMVRYANDSNTEPCDCNGSCDSATCVPTNATDAVYQALVDSFWDKPYVMFGVTNEGGGFHPSAAILRTLMSHVVDVIRSQEASHGGQQHLIAVQSTGYTSSSSDYANSPLSQTNVIYEHHGYPPDNYVFTNIPVIIGEWGPSDTSGNDVSSLNGMSDAFESHQVPSLAWMFEPMNGVTPPLVTGWAGATDRTEATLQVTPWGQLVKSYLLAH